MASGAPFTLNFLYLLFFLVPGFAALQAYLHASVQLDSMSRLDKLLSVVLGGGCSLIVMLILNRFGIFNWLVVEWYDLWQGGHSIVLPEPILYPRFEYAVTAEDTNSFTALSLGGFIFIQSAIGYLIGFLYGTKQYIDSPEPQRMHDLEQPWEIAVRKTKYGEKAIVITKNDERIEGKIERIGSPSQDYDILLFAAERIDIGGEPEPLGMTYHHYRDISRVQFPNLKPSPNRKGNWLAEKYELLIKDKSIQKRLLLIYQKHIYKKRFAKAANRAEKLEQYLIKRKIIKSVNRAEKLEQYLSDNDRD